MNKCYFPFHRKRYHPLPPKYLLPKKIDALGQHAIINGNELYFQRIITQKKSFFISEYKYHKQSQTNIE